MARKARWNDPLLTGICVGGDRPGTLVPQVVPHLFTFRIGQRLVTSGSHELPPYDVLYTLSHFVASNGHVFHVWYSDNGDSQPEQQREALFVLLDASASERAAVECRSVNDCQLTSPSEVVS
jgi:hypothetical protein